MAIAEGAVLQQVTFGEEIVDLMRHLGAGNMPGFSSDMPYSCAATLASQIFRRGRVDFAYEHGAFQRHVIGADTIGKVFRLRISPRCRWRPVTGLCAPSVLMPDWNQTQVSRYSASGKDAGDLGLHRVAARHRHVNFAGAFAHRILDCVTADVGNCRALANERDLCS